MAAPSLAKHWSLYSVATVTRLMPAKMPLPDPGSTTMAQRPAAHTCRIICDGETVLMSSSAAYAAGASAGFDAEICDMCLVREANSYLAKRSAISGLKSMFTAISSVAGCISMSVFMVTSSLLR